MEFFGGPFLNVVVFVFELMFCREFLLLGDAQFGGTIAAAAIAIDNKSCVAVWIGLLPTFRTVFAH